MDCPVCKTIRLGKIDLEDGLPSLKCGRCGGNWIDGSAYWGWLEGQEHRLPERQPQDVIVTDIEKAKLCPECQRIMIKYRVGHGLEFALDHCHSCRGIWLDSNEWAALKNRHLHDAINAIFTAPWQTEIEKESQRKEAERMYVNRFGVEDYAEMRRVRTWLNKHPRREEILAYFDDPASPDESSAVNDQGRHDS